MSSNKAEQWFALKKPNIKILLLAIGIFKATCMIARIDSCMVSSCLLSNLETLQRDS